MGIYNNKHPNSIYNLPAVFDDLRVIHDNHKAGCENKLHPAYHLLEKMKLLSKPVFKNFISNKVQNDVWIAIFMQLFLVALDKTFFRD